MRMRRGLSKRRTANLKGEQIFWFAAGLGLVTLAGEVAAGCSRKRIESWPEPSDPSFWRWVRDQLSVPKGESYFNVGTLGPRPRAVTEAVVNHMRETENTIAHYDYRP